ncbi:purine and uridine phosphorylase [Lindgomyces ingoldianus]|uniref:Purine and uridine phosphorylase n=1 Tax=Lindgomyces ingoldianus TaxID=673940 RepID=A0ACB6Q8Q7_9PLEO|nr:purine and uridine phosphorylase [Lindgomyces ingoldianus]KAF2463262.1 purine and uridine phosphorylase [Lindgomyces ingoldianus]
MSDPMNYTISWICTITTEYNAARAFLEEVHEKPQHLPPHDNNVYTLGRVGKHNIVIAVIRDGEYGMSSALSIAINMLSSFPNIRIGLVVGIGGGVPSPKHDIRLGDIVVSAPRGGMSGVFRYDVGKTIRDQKFRATTFLNQPPTVLRTAIMSLKAQYEVEGHRLEEAINSTFEKNRRLREKYRRPDPSSDRLHRTGVTHPSDNEASCNEASCTTVCSSSPSNLISRPERTKDEDNPAIHYGLIASGFQVVKDAQLRDELAAEMEVLCFEMEAAGLMNHFPCLVIRGICDYSDSHKNKEWQGYAAMAAAAYAKELLYQIPTGRLDAGKNTSDLLSFD